MSAAITAAVVVTPYESNLTRHPQTSPASTKNVAHSLTVELATKNLRQHAVTVLQ
jgi:hypothetical protein